MENCHNPKWDEGFSLLVHYPETQVGGQAGGWAGGQAGGHRGWEALAAEKEEAGSAERSLGIEQHQCYCCMLFCGGALKRRCTARPPPPQVLVAKLYDYDAFDRDDEIGRWAACMRLPATFAAADCVQRRRCALC
jgi:hypothetical protein